MAKKGLQQCYPLSPILFMLSMEKLSAFISGIVRAQEIEGGSRVLDDFAFILFCFLDDILRLAKAYGGIAKSMEANFMPM